jgi:hypothetical protein
MVEIKGNKHEAVGTIVNLKQVADGKVTIIVTKEEEIPDISFFTRSYDGKPQYEELKEGNKYKLIWYVKDNYNNLLSAEILEEGNFVKSNEYKPEVPDKDRRISRLAVLNTSTEITKLKYQNKLIEKDIVSEIVELAEELEKWVYR